MAYNPEYFKVGQIETYMRPVTYNGNNFQEYIHCKVVEHLEIGRDNIPEKIKVLQIHNLLDFLNGIRTDVSEKELYVNSVNPLVNISRNIKTY
ncbi:hypothetical protein DVK85_04895 [Flavobacterium arcticum]|uniref:Uncharacterized protein n=1 Tax=Flavobacterium arcticum TaxID=1784713 RepID=A0A345HAJ1_9FLAO|nr:hypothetical protein [Flavobacterium arcticum]AXG73601.1 hypothetical protein DVK85_04895 [Flavobacterium arcticum]KAF2506420.1 hypothetical protein E0W72_13265 [Flavobacterium arcticum]